MTGFGRLNLGMCAGILAASGMNLGFEIDSTVYIAPLASLALDKLAKPICRASRVVILTVWKPCRSVCFSRLSTLPLKTAPFHSFATLEPYKQGLGDLPGVAQLSLVSPVAWQHINFHGRYEFGKQPELIDLTAIIQQLAQLPIQ
jgi:hypothetical protein